MFMDTFKSLLFIVVGKKASYEEIKSCSQAAELKIPMFDKNLIMSVLNETDCRVYMRKITDINDVESFFPDELIDMIERNDDEPVAVVVSEFLKGGTYNCSPVVDELVQLELEGRFAARLYLRIGETSSA